MNAELNPDEGFILAKDVSRKKNKRFYYVLMADFTNSLSINILNPSVLYLSDYLSNRQSYGFYIVLKILSIQQILFVIYPAIHLSIYL